MWLSEPHVSEKDKKSTMLPPANYAVTERKRFI
jgi:hypothetical protein